MAQLIYEAAARALQALGLYPGQLICVCLPDIPERQITFDACVKLGIRMVWIDATKADTTVVRRLLLKSRARVIVVVDWCIVAGRLLPTKAIVDRASVDAPDLLHIVVVKNLGKAISWLDGRDLSWDAFLDLASVV